MEKLNHYLGNIEKTKKPHEILAELETATATDINQKTAESYGVKNLLKPDGTIEMENFNGFKDGIYLPSAIRSDQEEVERMKLEFSSALVPNTAEYYAKEKNCHTPEAIVAHWEGDRKKSKSGMFESAMFVLLNKHLGEDFLVVRTAAYDDYKGGVDNLIINRETGDVICAFDEVHDSKGGVYTENKLKKHKEIARGGGAKVKYGLAIEKGGMSDDGKTQEKDKLKQAAISNLPVFAISLTSKKFEELLPVLLRNGLKQTDETEKGIMRELLESLGEQAGKFEAELDEAKESADNRNPKMSLSAREEAKKRVKANMEKFNDSLSTMKSLIEEAA